MKKITALLLALMLTLGLLAVCSAEKDNVLKVAMSPDFAPMEFVDPTKTGQEQFIGFDVMLSQYIAENLGLELEIMPMSFDACLTAVYTGNADLGISGFSWSEKRENNYNISDYYQAGDNETSQILVTLKQFDGQFTTAESLKGVKVGVQAASLQEELAKSQLTESEIVPFQDLGTGILMMKNGDFDVLACARGNGEAMMINNPDVIKTGFEFEVDAKLTDNVILLKKGNDALTAEVNAIMAQAKEEGLYEKWYAEAQELIGVGQEVTYEESALSTFFRNVKWILHDYWKLFLLEGLKNTLILTAISVAMGTIIGSLVALMKMSKYKLIRFLISIYIEVIRGTPILLQLYVFYFVVPKMLPFMDLSPFVWVAIALCLNSAAYVSEVIRSGIQAVDKGQMEAARSLGLNHHQTMNKIIMPQAVRNILPALGNEFIMMLKETSLASTFFLGDLMSACLTVKGATFLPLEPMFIVGALYLLLTFPLSKLVQYYEKKLNNPNSYKNHKKTA